MTRVVAIAAVALLAAAAPAWADNQLTIRDGAAFVYSDDPGIANAYEIDERGPNIRFFEPKDPKGWSFPPECQPGQTQGSAIVEVLCPRSRIAQGVTVETGPGQDAARYTVNGIAGTLSGDTGTDQLTSTGAADDSLIGDQGNDTLDAGPGDDEVDGDDGNDTVRGGDGNDRMSGGSSADVVEGGNGDDTIRSADGHADRVDCGAGNDTVVADTLDELANCEDAQRQAVEGAPEPTPADDGRRPTVRLGGLTSQRITRGRRTLRVLVTSSEAGEAAVSGFLDVGGVNERLSLGRAKIPVGGAGAEIRLRLSARVHRAVLRDLRRGRRPVAHITASSVDNAGNTSRAKRLAIRLRR